MGDPSREQEVEGGIWTVIKVTTRPNNPNLKIGDKIKIWSPPKDDSNCWYVFGIQRGDLNLTHVDWLYTDTDTTKEEASLIFEEHKATIDRTNDF